MAIKYTYTSGQVPADPKLRTADELSALYGNVNYDENDILNKLNVATTGKYKNLRNEYNNNANAYYSRMADTQNTTLDTMRKNNAAAIATGASTGANSANTLSALLGLQQSSLDDSTQLAQDYAGLVDKEQAEYATNVNTAMDTANNLKLKLGELSSNIYGYDVQNRVGDLSYLAELENALSTLEGIKYSSDNDLLASRYNSDKNLEGTKYNADKNYEGTKYNADKNYLSNMAKVEADKAYYNAQLRNYANSGSGNGGDTQRLIDILDKAVRTNDFNTFLNAMIDSGTNDLETIKSLWNAYNKQTGDSGSNGISGPRSNEFLLRSLPLLQNRYDPNPDTSNLGNKSMTNANEYDPLIAQLYTKLNNGVNNGLKQLLNAGGLLGPITPARR